jgi:hypothetical protein
VFHPFMVSGGFNWNFGGLWGFFGQSGDIWGYFRYFFGVLGLGGAFVYGSWFFIECSGFWFPMHYYFKNYPGNAAFMVQRLICVAGLVCGL